VNGFKPSMEAIPAHALSNPFFPVFRLFAIHLHT